MSVAGAVRSRRPPTTGEPSRPERAGAIVADGVRGISRDSTHLGVRAVPTVGHSAPAFPPAFRAVPTGVQIRHERVAMRRLLRECHAPRAARVARRPIV